MNIYKKFIGFFPKSSIDVGTVIQVYTDGALVELRSGGYVRCLGSTTVGSVVFIRNKDIIGEAPTLVGSIIDI